MGVREEFFTAAGVYHKSSCNTSTTVFAFLLNIRINCSYLPLPCSVSYTHSVLRVTAAQGRHQGWCHQALQRSAAFLGLQSQPCWVPTRCPCTSPFLAIPCSCLSAIISAYGLPQVLSLLVVSSLRWIFQQIVSTVGKRSDTKVGENHRGISWPQWLLTLKRFLPSPSAVRCLLCCLLFLSPAPAFLPSWPSGSPRGEAKPKRQQNRERKGCLCLRQHAVEVQTGEGE